jgi:hypothetical protein
MCWGEEQKLLQAIEAAGGEKMGIDGPFLLGPWFALCFGAYLHKQQEIK